ncbi:MAG: hypothetical protein PWQ54_2194 [Bacteroidales bacterium]|jgi:hypothetical protein|nr:hypothetical protein [Bacteroidales bacterium]
MKSLIASFLITIGLPLVTFSQVFTGEEATAEPQQQTQAPKDHSKGGSRAFKTKYIHFIYFMPDMTSEINHTYGPFKTGAGPKWGAMIESGAFRFFDDNFMFKGAGNIGLYSSFGFGVSIHDFNVPRDFDGLKLPFFFADLKLGPDIRLEFIDFAKVDLYGNIGVLASYGGLVGNIDQDFTFYKPTKPVFALQTGVGLNVALGRFVLGVQYTMAKGSYEFEVTEDLTVYPNGPVEDTQQYDVNLNSLRLHIGIYTERRRR